MMDGFTMHGWGMGWGWIIGLVLLIFVFWMVTKSNRSDRTIEQSKDESALDILKKRYARGEIDKEEFEQRKKDLM